jgi:uncharacterized protein YjaZ
MTLEGESMTSKEKSIVLKEEILKQYKSIRKFAIEMNIPYSTMVTALERGIEGMAYGTVVRICEKLNLNPISFKPLEGATVSEQLLENQVMSGYLKLNKLGRERTLEVMEDFASLEKYRA